MNDEKAKSATAEGAPEMDKIVATVKVERRGENNEYVVATVSDGTAEILLCVTTTRLYEASAEYRTEFSAFCLKSLARMAKIATGDKDATVTVVDPAVFNASLAGKPN